MSSSALPTELDRSSSDFDSDVTQNVRGSPTTHSSTPKTTQIVGGLRGYAWVMFLPKDETTNRSPSVE